MCSVTVEYSVVTLIDDSMGLVVLPHRSVVAAQLLMRLHHNQFYLWLRPSSYYEDVKYALGLPINWKGNFSIDTYGILL